MILSFFFTPDLLFSYNLEDEAITHRAGFQHRPFPARVSSVFYDIDGTIKPSIERNIPRANSDAIEAMRGLGIKVSSSFLFN
jgi:hypothetical protein